MMDDSRMRGERLSVKEKWRGGGSEVGSDLDPDQLKMFWIRQNDADHLDPDPQYCMRGINGRRVGCLNHKMAGPHLSILLFQGHLPVRLECGQPGVGADDGCAGGGRAQTPLH